MSDPLFSVGETVYLVSRMRPDLSGPTKVLLVERGLGCDIHTRGTPAYVLDIACPPVGNHTTGRWCECTLRKRPPPEPLVSFDDVMAGLTDKEKVE